MECVTVIHHQQFATILSAFGCLLEEYLVPIVKYGRVQTKGIPVMDISIRQKLEQVLGNFICKPAVVMLLYGYHYHRLLRCPTRANDTHQSHPVYVPLRARKGGVHRSTLPSDPFPHSPRCHRLEQKSYLVQHTNEPPVSNTAAIHHFLSTGEAFHKNFNSLGIYALVIDPDRALYLKVTVVRDKSIHPTHSWTRIL